MDTPPHPPDLLIRHRRLQDDFAAGGVQDQVAVTVQAERIRAFKGETNKTGVRARRDDEVVLQPALVRAVVDQVDAGIDLPVADLAVVRDIRAPLRRVVADQVVAPARLFVYAGDLGIGVRAEEMETNNIDFGFRISDFGVYG